MKLHDLIPNAGSTHVRKRKGHGLGAGQGKTGGRGTKGEGARSGTGGHLYRQGGALPFYRRLPFMRGEGFTPPFQVEYNEVNLDQLDRFPADTVVTTELLAQAGMLHKNSDPVVILGRGDLTRVLTVKVQRISKSARVKIEAAGGTVELVA